MLTSGRDEAVLEKRFIAGVNLYNAVLQAGKDTINDLRRHPDYAKAVAIKPSNEALSVRRAELFKSAHEQSQFSLGRFERLAAGIAARCFIGDHLDSLTVQNLAERAFYACKEHVFGRKGKPRFKKSKDFNCLEGKWNRSGLRVDGSTLTWNTTIERIDRRPLGNMPAEQRKIIAETEPQRHLKKKIPLVIPLAHATDNDHDVHSLESEIKRTRVVRRILRGKTRYYTQIVHEGIPFRKQKAATPDLLKGTTAFDMGPKHIAQVSIKIGTDGKANPSASKREFCAQVRRADKEKRVLQRRADRQLRGANTQNYNENGTIKKGRRKWNTSKNLTKTRVEIANLARKEAAARKCEHGQKTNEMLLVGVNAPRPEGRGILDED